MLQKILHHMVYVPLLSFPDLPLNFQTFSYLQIHLIDILFAIMGVLRGLFQGKSTMLPTAVSQILEQIVNAVVSIFAASCFSCGN